jgi:glycosyltransferase involved in cell wall biosynthesis
VTTVIRPGIAVVIPLYNHFRYIGAALDSVLAQTSDADEIVLIDDGSTDGGIAVAERMLRDLPTAKVFRQPNRGAHVTINRLVEATRSEYVAVLNSDDLFDPGKLARCRQLLASDPGIGLLCGGIGLIDDTGRRVRTGPAVDWLRRATAFRQRTGLQLLSLLNENFVCTTSNMVFSRALWRDCGGFANLRTCHDLDFLAAAPTHGVVHIDDREHILYRVHAANTITRDIADARIEIAAVIAVALSEAGASRLLEGAATRDRLAAFMRMLDGKAMTGLVCYLMALSRDFPDRFAFYDHLATADTRDLLRDFVG